MHLSTLLRSCYLVSEFSSQRTDLSAKRRSRRPCASCICESVYESVFPPLYLLNAYFNVQLGYYVQQWRYCISPILINHACRRLWNHTVLLTLSVWFSYSFNVRIFISYFNETHCSYSILGPHDSDDIFKAVDSTVKITNFSGGEIPESLLALADSSSAIHDLAIF